MTEAQDPDPLQAAIQTVIESIAKPLGCESTLEALSHTDPVKFLESLDAATRAAGRNGPVKQLLEKLGDATPRIQQMHVLVEVHKAVQAARHFKSAIGQLQMLMNVQQLKRVFGQSAGGVN